MTLRVLIADDEPVLRASLFELLQKSWPEVDEFLEASNGVEALKAIIKHTPTVAFLDISMPGMTGLQVAEQCKEECHVVFVTAYDQYAIEAFDNNAIDYLLKPVSIERLADTIERLKQRLDDTPPALPNAIQGLAPPSYLSWLKALSHDEIQLINTVDVDYFQSGDKYTSAFVQGKEYVLRISLKKLEQQLNPEHFWRIHRGTIIRLHAIETIEKTFSGHLMVTCGGSQLSVSRAYQHLFKQD